jgi:hypothetical protein
VLAGEPEVPRGVDVFVEDRDLGRRLHDLERVRHVVDPRRADHEAFRLGIRGMPAAIVHLALRERQRQVRNLVALDNALARRNAKLRRVILDIPDCRVDRLPDPLQIGLAVGGSRHAVRRAGWRLRQRDRHAGENGGGDADSQPHYCPPPMGDPANSVRPSGSLTSVALMRSD